MAEWSPQPPNLSVDAITKGESLEQHMVTDVPALPAKKKAETPDLPPSRDLKNDNRWINDLHNFDSRGIGDLWLKSQPALTSFFVEHK